MPGEYNWSSIDAMVRETTNHGVKPFFFLYGTPDLGGEDRTGAASADKRDCSTYRADLGQDAAGVRGLRGARP